MPAHRHFEKGEYREALVVMRKIDVPGFYYTHLPLAAIHAELAQESEARSSLEEVLRLWPGFTMPKWVGQMHKWNYSDGTKAAGSQHSARRACRTRGGGSSHVA
jgi:hypothetical protein